MRCPSLLFVPHHAVKLLTHRESSYSQSHTHKERSTPNRSAVIISLWFTRPPQRIHQEGIRWQPRSHARLLFPCMRLWLTLHIMVRASAITLASESSATSRPLASSDEAISSCGSSRMAWRRPSGIDSVSEEAPSSE